MNKLNQVKKLTRKPWLVVGMLLSLAIIGVGGCGTKAAAPSSAASSTQASASSANSAATKEAAASSADSATTKQAAASQENQGQTSQKPTPNPAVEAAMEIRALQNNQQMVLTTDQKDQIKPILQLLIDTANPSQDFLQQKADAIKAVFTDQQKSYLSANTPQVKPNGNPPNGQAQPNDQTKGANSASDGNSTAPQGQPQNIFKQVLASLT